MQREAAMHSEGWTAVYICILLDNPQQQPILSLLAVPEGSLCRRAHRLAVTITQKSAIWSYVCIASSQKHNNPTGVDF